MLSRLIINMKYLFNKSILIYNYTFSKRNFVNSDNSNSIFSRLGHNMVIHSGFFFHEFNEHRHITHMHTFGLLTKTNQKRQFFKSNSIFMVSASVRV